MRRDQLALNGALDPDEAFELDVPFHLVLAAHHHMRFL
jgi:hypothetical protein